MEVPRLGVESELQLPAYTTATATRDPSCTCDLHCSSWQSRILNPLCGPRERTCILMNWSGSLPLSQNGNSLKSFKRHLAPSLQEPKMHRVTWIRKDACVPARTRECLTPRLNKRRGWGEAESRERQRQKREGILLCF